MRKRCKFWLQRHPYSKVLKSSLCMGHAPCVTNHLFKHEKSPRTSDHGLFSCCYMSNTVAVVDLTTYCPALRSPPYRACRGSIGSRARDGMCRSCFLSESDDNTPANNATFSSTSLVLCFPIFCWSDDQIFIAIAFWNWTIQLYHKTKRASSVLFEFPQLFWIVYKSTVERNKTVGLLYQDPSFNMEQLPRQLNLTFALVSYRLSCILNYKGFTPTGKRDDCIWLFKNLAIPLFLLRNNDHPPNYLTGLLCESLRFCSLSFQADLKTPDLTS